MLKIRHLLLFALIVISISAKSQFSKGDRLIGGSINFYSNNSSFVNLSNPGNNSNNGINTGITPRFSWVIKENLINGIILNGNYSRSKNSNDNPENYSIADNYTFGIGYFIRNFKDFTQHLGWFVEYNALLNYNSSKNEYSSVGGNANSYKTTGLSAGVNIVPGLYYKASPKVVIEGSFGGLNANYYRNINSGYKTRTFNIGLNFPSSFSLGVQFLLNKKINRS